MALAALIELMPKGSFERAESGCSKERKGGTGLTVQLLQPDPPSRGNIALELDVRDKLLNLMAQMMLTTIAPKRKEAGHDRQSS